MGDEGCSMEDQALGLLLVYFMKWEGLFRKKQKWRKISESCYHRVEQWKDFQ